MASIAVTKLFLHNGCYPVVPQTPIVGVYREAVKSPMNTEFEFISWCSVDLEEILQDNRRRTPMNADFIPDKLWSIAIYGDFVPIY